VSDHLFIFVLNGKLPPMRDRNILLALALSIALTVAIEVVYIIYAFYPLIAAMFGRGPSAGIGAIGGAGFLLPFVIGPLLFVVIFGILQWRSGRR